MRNGGDFRDPVCGASFAAREYFLAPEFQRPVLMCASAISSTCTVKKANRPPAFQLSTVWPCSSYVSSMHSNYY